MSNFKNIPKILIDGRPLFSAHKDRGIGRFTKNLIENISKQNKQFDIRILVPRSYTQKHFLGLLTERIIIWPKTKNLYLLLHQLLIPFILWKNNYDLFHNFEPTSIVCSKTKKIMIVHDTIKSIMPLEYKQGPISRLIEKVTESTLRSADCIITVSNNSKKDIIKYLNICQDKINIVSEAVDPEFHPTDNNKDEFNTLKTKYDIEGKYIIYIGNYASSDKRKNVPFLLNIIEKFNKDLKESMMLVLVGKIGPYYLELKKIINEKNISSLVRFTDFINDSDLSIMLSYAECLAFPSFYEGFGLPLIEAMTCGCPVIAYANSSITEVVKDAGILVNDKDEELFYKELTNLIHCDELKNKLREKGLKRSLEFSWEKSAYSTLDIYKELLSENIQ